MLSDPNDDALDEPDARKKVHVDDVGESTAGEESAGCDGNPVVHVD